MTHKITARDLLTICSDFQYELSNNPTSPGNFVTSDDVEMYSNSQWKMYCMLFEDAEKKFKKICDTLGVEFDIYGSDV